MHVFGSNQISEKGKKNSSFISDCWKHLTKSVTSNAQMKTEFGDG